MGKSGWLCIVGFLLAAPGCGVQYSATVICLTCNGPNNVFGVGCSSAEAVEAAKQDCRNRKGKPLSDPEDVTSSLVFLACTGQQKDFPAELRPIPETVDFLRKGYATIRGADVAAADDDPLVCEEEPAIDFTVVASNQRHEDEFPCRDVRVVRVGYTKWITATQSVEDVTLEATVAFGSSHTFNITDAYARAEDGTPDPQGVADNIFVLYQGFNDFPDGDKCTTIPLDQGGPSRSFNGLIKDGGRLDVALLGPGAGSTFSFTITNPPSPVALSSSSTTTITPIPDPKFARRSR